MNDVQAISNKSHSSEGRDEDLPARTPPAEDETPAGAGEPAWIEARQLALKQLDRLVGLEAKVLRGNRPEAVHAMRVASRRLQEMLDLIYAKPRPQGIRRLRKKIRRCRKILSELRNCDVLLDRAQKRLSSAGAAHRPAWVTVSSLLSKRREILFSKAVKKLTRINLPEVYLTLRETLLHDPATVSTSGNGAGQFDADESVRGGESLRERLAHELTARWEEFERQARKVNEDPASAGLHASRIAAKKLRYLIEVAAEFDIKGSRQALVWLKKLQAVLGDWHDLEMSEALLAEIVGDARFIRDNLAQTPAVLRLIGIDRKTKEKLRQKGIETLRRVMGSGDIRNRIEAAP